MKKKWLWLLAVLAAILLVPIPVGQAKDGGTRAYRSLSYTVVAWRRIVPAMENGLYEQTAIYWFPESGKTLDELWKTHVIRTVTLTVAQTLPSCVAIREDCFYAYDDRGNCVRVRHDGVGLEWLEEGMTVTVEGFAPVAVAYPEGTPSGWNPQLEITAYAVKGQ